MKKPVTKVIIILMTILLLFGCAPQHENVIDELAIILGLGLDIDENNPELCVVTTTNPTFLEEAEVPVIETTVKGYGLDGAFKNWEYQRQNVFGLGKVATVIFGQQIAENGLRELVTELRQLADMNVLAHAVYYPGRPQDAWAINPPEEPRRAIFLMNLLERVRDEGLMPRISICELNTNILLADKDGMLPRIELTEDEKRFHVTGLALLDKDGKLATVLNDVEMLTLLKLYNDAIGAFNTTKVNFQGQEGIVSYVLKNHRRTKVDVSIKDGKPSIQILVPIDIEVRSVWLQGVEVLSREFVNAMEEEIARDLTLKSQELIEKMQRYETDPLGLGQWVRIRQKEYYNKGTWRDDYPTADIRCSYDVRVKRFSIVIEE